MFPCRAARAFADEITAMAVSFDAGELLPTEAAQVVADMTRIERAASALAALAAAKVAASEVWRAGGAASPAEWFARTSGQGIGTARERLTAAKRLESLPATSAAARRGELSSAQVSAIAEAAAHAPSSEAELLAAAPSDSLKALRERCSKVKQAADPTPTDTYNRIRRERRWYERRDADGGVHFGAYTTADDAAWVRAALDRETDEVWADAKASGDEPESQAAYRLDAFVRVCRRSIEAEGSGRAAAPDPPAAEPDTSPTESGDRPANTGSTSPKARKRAHGFLALIRVDLAALQRGMTRGDETCDIAGVGPVPVAAVRELLGDATLKLVITKGVGVVNVTHLGRAPTVAQRMALAWQTPGCSIAGCDRCFVDIDHVVDWSRTHHTKLCELERFCTHHHWLKTRHGWAAITDDAGNRVMVPPTDERHPRHGERKAS